MLRQKEMDMASTVRRAEVGVWEGPLCDVDGRGRNRAYLFVLAHLVFPTHLIKLAREKKGTHHFRGSGVGQADGA